MNIPLRSLFFVGAAFLGATLLASGQSFVTQVKDINMSGLGPSTAPDSMVNVNGTLFVATDDPVSGAELWKFVPGASDFTFVRDINPGTGSSSPTDLTAVGSRLFFSATATGGNSKDLWTSDGTRTGTILVEDLPFGSNSGPAHLTSFNGLLFFEGRDDAADRELWQSDGTAAGTKMIKDIRAEGDSFIDNLAVVGGTKLFFTADDNTGQALWMTDGTELGTVKVKDITEGLSTEEFEFFTDFQGQLFFRAIHADSGFELWKSDGTPEGTGIVREIQLGQPGGGPRELTPVNLSVALGGPTLFFTADNGLVGRELWKTDGTEDGTVLVRDIRLLDNSDTDDTVPNELTEVNGTLFFTACATGTDRELWKSDGSFAGTVRVKDIVAGTVGSDPANLINLNNSLLFTVVIGNNLQLWKSGGASNGSDTVLVSDLPETTGAGVAAISNLVVINNLLFFKLNDDEVWQTDGTGAGTVKLKSFREGNGDSSPAGFATLGNEAFFAATDGINGEELWKTDGSGAGTVLVSDIAGGAASSKPMNLRSIDDRLFFSAAGNGTDRELWMVDNTGTASLLRDINTQDAEGSEPANLTEWNGMLFFSADERNADPGRTTGVELWKSDGTPGGTELVKDINGAAADSSPHNLFPMDNALFFAAATSTVGTELWKTDGTADGTVLVKDIRPGGFSSNPSAFVRLGNTLYFAASDGNQGRELWKSDGVPDGPGTQVVKDIRTGGVGAIADPSELAVIPKLNLIFFAANDGVNGVELWKSNGTSAGTVLVKDIKTGLTGSTPNSSSPTQLVVVGDKLFFIADDGANGAELWVSNGTAGGTLRVSQIVANGGSGSIQNLTDVNGVACFTADDGVNGRELWVSDGTLGGTKMVQPDLTGDDSSSMPDNLFSFNTGLLFSASTRSDGNEPHFAAVGPDIVVEHPPGTDLVDGVGTVDFGTLAFGDPGVSLTLTIKNTGLNTLTGVAATISGKHAADFTILTPKPLAKVFPTGTAPDSTTVTIKFTAKENGPREATLHIVSNDANESPFDVNLTGTGVKDPAITDQPEAQMVQVGDPVTFTADATSSVGDMTFQWRKNNGTIPKATDKVYEIFSAALTHAGAYTFQAKNTLNVVGTSDVAELGVVENLPKTLAVAVGKVVTMAVKAAGNGLTYQWKRNGVALVEGGRITGSKGKSLVIKNLGVGDTGVYTCEVSGPGGMAVGGETDLRVFSGTPVLAAQVLPNGIVSGLYGGANGYQIVLSGGPELTPTSYSATGLPPNVKLNTKTGLISGRPIKAGPFKVKISASNSFGKSNEITTDITIDTFPANLQGDYAGPVARDALNGDLGGRFDLKVTGTGAFTGSLTMGTVKYAFKGALDIALNGTPESPAATIIIKRKVNERPLTVTFDMLPAVQNTLIQNGKVTDGTAAEAAFNGWQNIWHATNNPATNFVGPYTFAFEEEPGSAPDARELPKGYGYGSFKVATNGTLMVAGKTPDGETITAGAFLSPAGGFLIYQALYTPKGSVLGVLDIDLLVLADPADDTISGALSLMRPENLLPSARIYEDGFGPYDLTAMGGRYVAPVAPALILGLEVGDDVAVIFDEGGLPASIDPNLSFVLAAGSKPVMPGDNPAAVKLTINAATGLFTGSFVLQDDELRTGSFAGKTFKRTAAVTGVLTKDGLGPFGAGSFKLEELPTDTTAPGATDINFGSVRLEEDTTTP